MRYFSGHKNKGQAMIEMAIFGSLVLFIFAGMLSYVQRQNDQQYTDMASFRRALEKACTYQGEESEGAGASVQFNVIENRKQVNLSGGFRKGSNQSLSASSSVYWAVPKVGSQAESVTIYRINEDEKDVNYRDYVPAEKDAELYFQIEGSSSTTGSSFEENIIKEETPGGIINTSTSKIKETITTVLPYTIRKKDKDDDPENDAIVEKGEFWAPRQGLYRGKDGQYKYSEQAAGTVIERGKSWLTGF